jgi:hypothetical protein
MRREAILFGWFLLVLGCSGILAGIGQLLNGSLPAAGLGCKAICGITQLMATLWGSNSASAVGGLLWLAAGGGFSAVGYRVLRNQRKS